MLWTEVHGKGREFDVATVNLVELPPHLKFLVDDCKYDCLTAGLTQLCCASDAGVSPRLSKLHSTALIRVQSQGNVYGLLSVSVQTQVGSNKVLEPTRATVIVTRSGHNVTLLV